MFNTSEFGQSFDFGDIGFQLLNPDDISAPFSCQMPNQDFGGIQDSFDNNFTFMPFNYNPTNGYTPMKSTVGTDYYDPMSFSIPDDDMTFNYNSFDNSQLTLTPFDEPNMSYPDESVNLQPTQVPSFEDVYNDETCIINPTQIHLLPEKYWSQQSPTLTFAQMVNSYFKQNRTQNSTFMLKLYNLLLISINYPILEKALGVRWVNDNVIEVSRSGLVNIFNLRENTVDGSMFHRQGNFPTHKFIEVNESNFQQLGFYEYPKMPRIQGDTKFFMHEPHIFTRRPMTEMELKSIKYSNEAKKTYRSRSEANNS